MIEQINAILPQTQCGQCGFKGCMPYAEAMATGAADINQCPPGGDAGIAQLAKLLGISVKPLNPEFGEHKSKQVAFIIEEDCIGCVKCIAACPVDAILGAAKFMHTVIAADCTGCELCISPCPVDCIEMRDVEPFVETEQDFFKTQQYAAAQLARKRYEAKNLRIEKENQEKAERAKQKRAALLGSKTI